MILHDPIEIERPKPLRFDEDSESKFPWETAEDAVGEEWNPQSQMQSEVQEFKQSEPLRIRLRGAPPDGLVQMEALSLYSSLFNGFLDAPAEALLAAEEKLANHNGDRRVEAAALLMIADAHISKEEPELAIHKAEEAMLILREISDLEGEAAAVHVLAKAFLVQGERIKALRKAEEALELFLGLEHTVGEGATVVLIAQLQLSTDGSAALKLAQEAVDLFHALGDRRREAIAQRTLLGSQLAQGNALAAIQVGKKVLATCRELSDRRSEGSALILLAEAYLTKGDMEEAAILTKEALQIFRSFQDKKNEAASLDFIAGVLLAREDPNEALSMASSAQSLFEELGDERRAALVGPKLVAAHLALKELDIALAEAQKMAVFFEAKQDAKQVAVANHELAKVHIARGEAQLAREHAKEARALFGEVEAWDGDVAVLQTLFQANFMDGRIEEGLGFAWEILAIYKNQGKRRQEGALLKDVANIELQMRLPVKALRHSEAAVKILEECSDAEGAAAAQAIAEKASWMKSVLKEAARMAEGVMEKYRATGNTEGLYEVAMEAYKTRLALAQYVR